MLNTAKSKEVTTGCLVIKDFGEEAVGEMIKFCYTGDLTDDNDVPGLIEVRALVRTFARLIVIT